MGDEATDKQQEEVGAGAGLGLAPWVDSGLVCPKQ